ncbi:hypothetical protein FDP41_008799 [Naegleria fowleri]|uniref:Cell division cycle protein 123 homolog n=1 Tax=Naegleria fowleri TaxID=5763 RepID=A0A6A5B4T4_NAEFO|nr:uncharacterized protein FDP41_008799 [Naegleria fowleri]KAF0972947.1 hypothetical protein FDP41_008799 [Naegleria fowleri]CAG4707771.1 unnamed protein product [Naegleria fowleri]
MSSSPFGVESEIRSNQEIHFWKSFDLDRWYPLVMTSPLDNIDESNNKTNALLTFPTHFILLSLEQICLLYKLMQDQARMKEYKRRISTQSGATSFNDLQDLFQDSEPVIRYIIEEIEKYFYAGDELSQPLHDDQNLPNNNLNKSSKKKPPRKAVFLRLSGNSPKDSAEHRKMKRNQEHLYQKLVKHHALIEEYMVLQNEYRKYSKDRVRDIPARFFNIQNELFKILREEFSQLLKVSSDDIMYGVNLILMSQRIRRGFEWILTNYYHHKDSLLNYTYIALREWRDDVNLRNEFRCFVHKKKLVAISQYDQHVFHPHVCEHKEEYIHAVKEFFEKELSRRLETQFESYVFDVMVLLSGERAVNNDIDDQSPYGLTTSSFCKVFLIELNPYDYHSSACLFNWRTDASILYGDTNNLEEVVVRVTTQQVQKLDHLWDYLDILQYVVDRRKQEQLQQLSTLGLCVASFLGGVLFCKVLLNSSQTK